MWPLRGSFWVLVLYDVAEQIELDQLCNLIGVEPVKPQPSFKHPAPEYVRFERPPVVEFPEPVVTATGERRRRHQTRQPDCRPSIHPLVPVFRLRVIARNASPNRLAIVQSSGPGAVAHPAQPPDGGMRGGPIGVPLDSARPSGS